MFRIPVLRAAVIGFDAVFAGGMELIDVFKDLEMTSTGVSTVLAPPLPSTHCRAPIMKIRPPNRAIQGAYAVSPCCQVLCLYSTENNA